MIQLIEKKEVDSRMVELREFSDAYVIFAWPKERPDGAVRLDVLGEFKNLEEAKGFMSQLVKI